MLLERVGVTNSTWNLATHAFRFAEARDRCADVLRDGERHNRRHGYEADPFIGHAWSYWHRDFGSVAAGAAHGQLALEAVQRLGVPLTITAIAAVTAENLIQLDELERAAELIDVDFGPARDTYIEPFALTTRGYVRFLQRRFEEAEADLRRTVELCDARGWKSPHRRCSGCGWPSCWRATGARDEALELMEHDLRVADAADLPRRARQRAADQGATRSRATTSIDAAARGGRRAGAERRTGWSWAGRCTTSARDCACAAPAGTPASCWRARSTWPRGPSRRGWRATPARELEASGARPRRELLSGVEALTPAERRVAEMAAEGLTNREIAEALWVTHKTVEMHLGRSYGKLGIRSRRQLVRRARAGRGNGLRRARPGK